MLTVTSVECEDHLTEACAAQIGWPPTSRLLRDDQDDLILPTKASLPPTSKAAQPIAGRPRLSSNEEEAEEAAMRKLHRPHVEGAAI